MTIKIRDANGETDIATARSLIEEFVRSLPINMDFQDVHGELLDFPGRFKRLLLAEQADGTIVGVVALKDLSSVGAGVCEMKRLYVQPRARSTGAGKALVVQLLEVARAEGYSRMVLDTISRLEAALRLYERTGFRRTEAYYNNPIEDVVYMEQEL